MITFYDDDECDDIWQLHTNQFVERTYSENMTAQWHVLTICNYNGSLGIRRMHNTKNTSSNKFTNNTHMAMKKIMTNNGTLFEKTDAEIIHTCLHTKQVMMRNC